MWIIRVYRYLDKHVNVPNVKFSGAASRCQARELKWGRGLACRPCWAPQQTDHTAASKKVEQIELVLHVVLPYIHLPWAKIPKAPFIKIPLGSEQGYQHRKTLLPVGSSWPPCSSTHLKYSERMMDRLNKVQDSLRAFLAASLQASAFNQTILGSLVPRLQINLGLNSEASSYLWRAANGLLKIERFERCPF